MPRMCRRRVPLFLKKLSSLPVLMGICGCAGPSNPWGHFGLNLPHKENLIPMNVRHKDKEKMRSIPKIKFYPTYQNLHSLNNFSIEISSDDSNTAYPSKVVDYKLFHNGLDVSKTWLKKSVIKYSKDKRKTLISFSHLKLPAGKDHNIVFALKRKKKKMRTIATDSLAVASSNKSTDDFSKEYLVIKGYQRPVCSFNQHRIPENLGRFSKAAKRFISSIVEESTRKYVNPSFMTGLIAQESAFDPYAVSSAKAIGLTQVTNGAALMVKMRQARYQEDIYPYYGEINDHSVMAIRSLIDAGEINPKNDWRLYPPTSISGGIEYLKYIENYWLSEEKRSLILKHYSDENRIMDELLLASYNSGPYRVKKALKEKGVHWLKHDELNEARKYVDKIMSYCYHFSQPPSPDFKERKEIL